MVEVKRKQDLSTGHSKDNPVVTSPVSAIGVRGHRVRDLVKAEERRREVLTGAARAFARAGYDATNMDQIASECGLAKGHIYHYFRSKEEIFNEIRTDAIKQAVEEIAKIFSQPVSRPEKLLRKMISALIARVLRQGGRYEQMLASPVSMSEENRRLARRLIRQFEAMFTAVLQDGIDKRVFVPGDPKLMTFVMLRAAITIPGWYREGGKWKAQWIVEQVTEQLLRSVLQPNVTQRK